jgi:hypothetical protein
MRIVVPIMRVEANRAYDREGTIVEPHDILQLKRVRDDEYYNNFISRSHLIQSNIQTYFSGCLRQRNVLMDLVQFLIELSNSWEFDDRAKFIQNHSMEFDKKLSEYEPVGEMIKDEINTPVFQTIVEAATARFNRRSDPKQEPIDDTGFIENVARRDILAWQDLKNAIIDKKDELAKAILKTEIPSFHLNKK